MFEKFQEGVRNTYLDLKKNNKLDFPREWPSTGDLKNWCLQCLERGLTKDDEAIFKSYFQASLSEKPLKEIVRKFEADKLRSLRNFILNDGTKRPDWEMVKLLAILVDFNPRPYNRDDWDDNSRIKKPPLKTDTEDEEEKKEKGNGIEKAPGTIAGENTTKEESTKFEQGTNDTGPIVEHEKTAVSNDDKENKRETVPAGSSEVNTAVTPPSPVKGNMLLWNKKYYSYGGLILVIFAIFIYSFMDKECMCWNGQRYIEVDCKDNKQPNQIIGLNQDKLHNFQKIMKPDTLSKADVGKVWYSKIDNEVEFFTHSGHHPIESRKSLKAATERIIRTHSGNKNLD